MDADRLTELADVAEKLGRSIPSGADLPVLREWIGEALGLVDGLMSGDELDREIKQKLAPASLNEFNKAVFALRRRAQSFTASSDNAGAARAALSSIGRLLREAQKKMVTSSLVVVRKKAEKFGLLDEPGLLAKDLAMLSTAMPIWGVSVLYLDVDKFKEMNSRFTERVVDKALLPGFQRLVADSVAGIGYAYAEGGDEVVIVLPNCSFERAKIFAEELRQLVSQKEFSVQDDETVHLTVSAGLAYSNQIQDVEGLADIANKRKAKAKDAGRNRVVSGD